jgi:excisionase family DNA binding protein
VLSGDAIVAQSVARPLTVRQLAAFLQVSPATIARQVRAGSLPFIRVGTQLRFVPAEVVRYLQSRRGKP